MDKIEKAKLKVLIKMILINKSPEYISSKKICDIINKYDWGFRSSITSKSISMLLKQELAKGNNHFMRDIELVKSGRGYVYGIC